MNNISEDFVTEMHSMYMLLFTLILRENDTTRLRSSDAILRILNSQIENKYLTPLVRISLQQLRDILLSEPDPELIKELYKPHIQLVK